jgi:spermidine/putrescine transport system permease protein
MDRAISTILRIYVVGMFMLIFTPIVVSFIFSFSADRFPTVPPSDYTIQWYQAVWNDVEVLAAAQRTFVSGLTVSILSTVIGFGAAYTDYRYVFAGKALYLGLGFMPPLVPTLILGLAMLFFLAQIGLSGGLHSVIIAHTVLCIPFATAVIRLRLSQMDLSLEAAAWNLGANQWQAMRHLVLPFCFPAILAALFVTAAVSFDEFAIAWFVSGLQETLPVRVLNFVQGQASPRINAIGSFTFTISVVLVALAQVQLLRNKAGHKANEERT